MKITELWLQSDVFEQPIIELLRELVGEYNIEELSPRKRDKHHDWGFMEVIHHCLDVMQNTISRLKLAAYSPDVTIDIPKNACGSFEFYRAKELIALGRHKAEKALIGMRSLDGIA